MTITGCFTAFALAAALTAAVTDHRTGHIPNWLTLGSLGAAPLLWLGAGLAEGGLRGGLSALGLSLAGLVVCSVGPIILFWRKGLGGGDVKIFAALGAILGPKVGINAELYAFVLGALFVPARLAWNGRFFRVAIGWARSLANPVLPEARRVAPPPELATRIRLGPAIFAGAAFASALAHLHPMGLS